MTQMFSVISCFKDLTHQSHTKKPIDLLRLNSRIGGKRKVLMWWKSHLCISNKRHTKSHPLSSDLIQPGSMEVISLSVASAGAQAILTHARVFPGLREELHNGSTVSLRNKIQSYSVQKASFISKGRWRQRGETGERKEWKITIPFIDIWSGDILVMLLLKYNLLCCFFVQQKDEVYLNLVLDYVPETVYRVARHYSRAKQTLPMVYVKVRTLCVKMFYQ